MSLVFAYTDEFEPVDRAEWEAGRPWPPKNWPPVPDVRNKPPARKPGRESQYIGSYLATTADPATRWTPWTYLRYTIRGSAWSSWSRGYYDALMRAISRRLADGTVIEVRSKGGSTAYIRRQP